MYLFTFKTCACACPCVCVCACVRVRVHAWVRADACGGMRACVFAVEPMIK